MRVSPGPTERVAFAPFPRADAENVIQVYGTACNAGRLRHLEASRIYWLNDRPWGGRWTWPVSLVVIGWTTGHGETLSHHPGRAGQTGPELAVTLANEFLLEAPPYEDKGLVRLNDITVLGFGESNVAPLTRALYQSLQRRGLIHLSVQGAHLGRLLQHDAISPPVAEVYEAVERHWESRWSGGAAATSMPPFRTVDVPPSRAQRGPYLPPIPEE